MAKETAILFNADEFENLLETLDILSNKKEVSAIAKGVVDVQRGETLTLSKYIACKKKNRTHAEGIPSGDRH